MKKKKVKKSKKTGPNQNTGCNSRKIKGVMPNLGDLGLFARHYPPEERRQQVIQTVSAIPEDQRTAHEWWLLGEYLTINGLMNEDNAMIDEGVAAHASAISNDPPSHSSMLDLAWIYIFKQMPSLAMPLLSSLTEIAPLSRDIWSLKAFAHIKLNQPVQATECYEKAARLDGFSESDKEVYKRLRENVDCKIISSSLSLLKIDPFDISSPSYTGKEFHKALRFSLRQSIKLEPKNRILRAQLGFIQYLLDEFEEAEELLEKYTSEIGDEPEILTILGLIQDKHYRDIDKAISFYKRAVAADQNYKLALVNVASLLQRKGDFFEARPFLEAALSFEIESPYHAIALDLYGNNVAEIEQDFEKEAQFHLSAHRLNSKNPLYIANAIISLLSSGQVSDAEQMFTRHKQILRKVENFDLLNLLVSLYSEKSTDPTRHLNCALEVGKLMGFPATRYLLRKAWKFKENLPKCFSDQGKNEPELQDIEIGFFNDLGMVAGQAGDTELAIKVWHHMIGVLKFKMAELNLAVEFSGQGRHDEALEIVNRDLQDMGERAYTVQGNIRLKAGFHLAAIESYKRAIGSEPDFLLPIDNAINCCELICRPDLADDFISELQTNWRNKENAELILGQALALKGRQVEATNIFYKIIYENDVIEPNELFEKIRGKEDLSLFNQPEITHHFTFGLALLRSGNYEGLNGLISSVSKWPEWMDGDWKVLLAEGQRQNGDVKAALETIDTMEPQPPTLLTRALCMLQEGDYALGKLNAKNALEYEGGAENYYHPEGRPDSVANAILALSSIESGEYETALNFASSAVQLDIGCALARTAFAKSAKLIGDTDDAIFVLQEGLKRKPGSPEILKMLIDFLLDEQREGDALEHLESQRDLLSQNNAVGLAERLGEVIALSKLKKFERENNVDADLVWSEQLSYTSQKWLSSSSQLWRKSEKLDEASLFYLSKIVEKEYGDRIFTPFKQSLDTSHEFITDEFKDFSRFLMGEYAPSLGAMHRVLKAASKEPSKSESKLITEFRKFIAGQENIETKRLLRRSVLDKLNTLAHVRNSLAHIGEPDLARIEKSASFILNKKKPGELLIAVGVVG